MPVYTMIGRHRLNLIVVLLADLLFDLLCSNEIGPIAGPLSAILSVLPFTERHSGKSGL